jgi:5-methylcytosine-specific restriction endonuclease McrA
LKKNYWTKQFRDLRYGWSKYCPFRKACFKEASRKIGNGLTKWECNTCKNLFALSEVQCDHIKPILNNCPQNEGEFYDSSRKLHSPELQILCKSCHKDKTRRDLNNHKYHTSVQNISYYLNLSDLFIINNIEEKIIHKFSSLITKISELESQEKDFTKYMTQLDILRKKYL